MNITVTKFVVVFFVLWFAGACVYLCVIDMFKETNQNIIFEGNSDTSY